MKPTLLIKLVALCATLGGVSFLTAGCAGQALMRQRMQQEQMAQQQNQAVSTADVQFPFQISTRVGGQGVKWDKLPWPKTMVYRLAEKDAEKEDEKRKALPVNANVYASARAIDVATGDIVWINTVNVKTAGRATTSGLERMGIAMATNFANGGDPVKDRLMHYTWNGQPFKVPRGWTQVRSAWKQRTAVGGGIIYRWKRGK